MLKARAIVFRFAAICLGIFCIFVAFELVLRIVGLGNNFYTIHPEIGYVIKPNVSLRLSTSAEGGSRRVVSNSKGLRDVEHDYHKPNTVKRILILGDSFCEALQVDLHQTFFRILQHKMDSAFTNINFEIINSGVSGYGTDEELLFYRHEGKKYQPDYVVVAFVFNDVRNNDRKMMNQMYGYRNEPYFILHDDELQLMNFPITLGITDRAKQVLRENFRSYVFIWQLIKGAELSRRAVDKKSKIPFDYFVFAKKYNADWKRAWQVTSALLTELQREVSQNGARLVVMAVTHDMQVYPESRMRKMKEFPAMKKVEWEWEKPRRLLHEVCSREGIAFIDLLEPFGLAAQQQPEKRLHFPGGHWTAHGHAVCADVLFGFFRDSIMQNRLSENAYR